MNKTILKISIGFIALALAICAAFFSIVGLSKLFAGAAIAVIAMASTLEASKLVIASFLSQYWTTVNKTLRAYLITAVVIIAAITSIGIYGFLSGAYQETKSKYDLTQTQTDSLTVKKTYYETSVNAFKTQLESKNNQLTNLTNIRNSQENRATQLINNNRSSNSADRSARQTDANIKSLTTEIDNLNKQVIVYSDSVSKMNVAITQLGLKNEISSELGSLAYISRVLGIPMDNVVNILIILFIIVFDPLAITMVLAFNFLNKKKEEPQPTSEPEQPVISDDKVYPSYEEREKMLSEMMRLDQEAGLYDDVILPESSTEQPSETGQIQPEPETLDIVTPEPEVIENTVEIAKETPLTPEEKKRIAKQEKAKQMYAGAISSNNTESKSY
jgi:hypothetical protein